MNYIILLLAITFLVRIFSNFLTLLILLLLIIFIYYQYWYKKDNKSIEFNNDDTNIGPIETTDWIKYWKSYFKDVKNWSKIGYYDIIKSLTHFQQIYSDALNSPKNQYLLSNLQTMHKECINNCHHIIYSLPTTNNEKLDNILNDKITKLNNELSKKIDEIRQLNNSQWNNQEINQFSQPNNNSKVNELDKTTNFNIF